MYFYRIFEIGQSRLCGVMKYKNRYYSYVNWAWWW